MNIIASLVRLLLRHKIVEFLSGIKAYSLISRIALYSSRKIDNDSSYNVVCIGRMIFDEDIEEISRHSGKVNYLIIPKIIFISIFNYHFHRIKFDHVNYHKDDNLVEEKRAYKKFLEKFLICLFNKVNVDAIMSANYVYVWQQELAAISLEKKIPFIVLHKEGMTSPSEYKNLVNTTINC